jgi:hypothetical protein
VLLRRAKQLSICGERTEIMPWQSIALSPAKMNYLCKLPSDPRRAKSSSVIASICKIKSLMVARGGIEPPIRGFSVR